MIKTLPNARLRHGLSDAQWSGLGPLLNRLAMGPGRPSGDNRRFLHAVLWMARAGAPWLDSPKALGHWRAVHARFLRWARKGIWRRLFVELADSSSVDLVSLGSVSLKAAPCASGARKRGKSPKASQKREALALAATLAKNPL